MNILISSDESETLERALRYTALFSGSAKLTLMSAAAGSDLKTSEAHLRNLSHKYQSQLEGRIRTMLVQGGVRDAILNEVHRGDYDLVILGIHLHKGIRHLRPKLIAREIARRINLPLLIVFPEWFQLERILVCTARQPDSPAVQLGGKVALAAGAALTILHVMSQIVLRENAEQADLERDAEELIAHQTPEGVQFERHYAVLKDLGLSEELIQLKVRHGITVDEILRESEEGAFDLIVVGALDVPSDESWHELRELLYEDLAERVLLEAKRPILIARSVVNNREWDLET